MKELDELKEKCVQAMKDVDLDEDVDRILEKYDWNYDKIDFYEFAKHFFELGINASYPLTFEDIRTIDRILDGMRNENQVFGFPKGFYNEALKRFKAQKGEKV